MTEPTKKQLRAIDAPFVAPGPSGVAVRDRLKHLTAEDEKVLRLVGAHLGSLASRDLKSALPDGLEHSTRHVGGPQAGLDRGVVVALGRVDHEGHPRPVGAGPPLPARAHPEPGSRYPHADAPAVPAGRGEGHQAGAGRLPVRSSEWFHKSRRLRDAAGTGWTRRGPTVRPASCTSCGAADACSNTRHHLDAAQLTEHAVAAGAGRRSAGSWPPTGSPASGTATRRSASRPDGEVSASSCPRRWRTWPTPRTAGTSWPPGSRSRTGARSGRDRVDGEPGRRLPHPPGRPARDRWYLTASWQRPAVQTIPLEAARAQGMIGVDTNADHLAAWRLDPTATRSATRAASSTTCPAPPTTATPRSATPSPGCCTGPSACGVAAIAVEDLDFTAGEDPRETRPQANGSGS